MAVIEADLGLMVSSRFSEAAMSEKRDMRITKTILSSISGLLLVGLFGCPPNSAVVNQAPGGQTDVGFEEQGDVYDGPGLTIDPELRDLNRELFEAQCTMIYRCCDEDERLYEMGIGTDTGEEECSQRSGGLSVDIWLAILSEAAASGRIEINKGLIEVCLDAYLAQNCGEWTFQEAGDAVHLPGCGEMIQPMLVEGEDCEQDYECVTDHCYLPMNSDDDVLGTCEPMAQKDQDCGEFPCAFGLYCDEFTLRCKTQGREGDSCRGDRECRSEFCDVDEDFIGICGSRQPLCTGG